MPLDLPESADEVVARAQADVQRELPVSDPYAKNSWLGALIIAAANRIFDFYIQLKAAFAESFPDTAVETLPRWAAIWGKTQQPATQATGPVVATGTAGATIPDATALAVTGAGTYTTSGAAVLAATSVNIIAFARTGSTAAATTDAPHNLATGLTVTVAGATNPAYNGTPDITVTGPNEFEYSISGTPADEPGATATASYTGALVTVISDDFGADTNLESGETLRLQSPLVGVNDTLRVAFDTVGGGTDQESIDGLRSRLLDRIQNPVALFNVAAITEKAKEVPGVTRVFVQEITPAPGSVTIYFTRDEDQDPVPDGSEVAAVKAELLEIKPANTSADEVIVLAPTPVTVNFNFGALVPNTPTMQSAIAANLAQFFVERASVGSDIQADAYRSAIFNAIDTVTGQRVQSFSLTTPTSAILLDPGELAFLGTVTFP